jgi:acetyl-CoA synthetase (ADP-forming)
VVNPVILHASRLAERAEPRVGPEEILHPRSVAVFGASDSKDKFGGRITHFLIRHGFAGALYPINPRRSEVLGRPAYPSIKDAPAPPDVAILALPGNAIVNAVSEAAEAGVGCCVIITTGFAEAGPQGIAWQAALVDVARRTGIRIVGPNCMGLVVPHHRLALCSSVVLDTDALRDGPIGLVSQSGALMVSIYDRAATDGIGFRHCVSLGNQADLELCDFIEYMVDDSATEAICVYVEGFLDGARFRRAAAAARAAGKPLLVLKTGRTEPGASAARSHTASLAGSFDVFAAVCREEGVVLARDPDDMVRAAHFLVRHRAPRPARGGVGVLSSSGGGTGIASDRLTELGLRLAVLSPSTKARLGELLLPPQADNPIDLGGRKVPEEIEIAGDAARIMFADPDVAYGLAILTSMPFFARRTTLIGEAAQATDTPVMITLTPGAAADAPRRALREIGQFYFDRFEDALRVVALVAEHDTLRASAPEVASRPAGLPDSGRGVAKLPAVESDPAGPRGAVVDGAARPLSDRTVKTLLGTYGVRLVREARAMTPEGVAKAAAEVGFPVVLKIVSPDVIHKSDVGGVRTGQTSAADVQAAAREMAAAVTRAMPAARIEGFLVQATARGEAEAIVGARRDPQFGPVVMVGLGGIAVEILKDVVFAPAPVTPARARAMIAALAAAPLFTGARGRPPLDVEAVVDTVVRVSWLAADLGPRLVDLEINPLIVERAGKGAVAVDARGSVAGDSVT